MAKVSPISIEIDLAEVTALLSRTEKQLGPQDHALVVKMKDALVMLEREVRRRGSENARLRRLFQLHSSEKTKAVVGDNGNHENEPSAEPPAEDNAKPSAGEPSGSSEAPPQEPDSSKEGDEKPDRPKKSRNNGRIPRSAYENATVHDVVHPTLQEGDACPCGCGGMVEEDKPIEKLRITGQPMFAANKWRMSRLLCPNCGTQFEAETPPEAVGPKCACSTSSHAREPRNPGQFSGWAAWRSTWQPDGRRKSFGDANTRQRRKPLPYVMLKKRVRQQQR